jgi:hypothetical protein
VTPLRVQVGSGTGPLAGWVHVDTDPAAPHLEHRSAPWDLPFADGSVAEVLAVDVLETLRPPDLPRTLLEWRRVLEPVGTLEVHGHDATAAMRAYLEGGWERKWAATGALFGLPCDPGDPRPPGAVPRRCALDPELLGDLLGRAGFGDVHTVRASRHGDLGGACADCDAVTAAVPGLRMIVVARPAAGCAGR